MSLIDHSPIKRPSIGRLVAIGLIVFGVVSGCGGDSDAAKKVAVYPVKGSVLRPDGKPLTAGRIVFVSKDGASSSTGKINSDGTFSLDSGVSGEGAPAGEYKIRVEPEEVAGSPKGKRSIRPGGNLPFPGKYTDEDASELTATVKPEPNQLEPFKLTNTPSQTASTRRRD